MSLANLPGMYYNALVYAAAGRRIEARTRCHAPDEVEEQVLPVVAEDERTAAREALSLKTVREKLAEAESCSVDVACLIGGEIFNKQFTFYAVDRERDFYILLKSDITDVLLKQREQNELLANALREAEQANVAKTAFLSSMSHEIRTPMNAIIGLDSIALKDPNLPARTREHLEKIGGSAKHLLYETLESLIQSDEP